MTEQDKVLVVIGEWVNEGGKKWNFEPEITDGDAYVQLYSGMTFSQLNANVKEVLHLRANNINVKLGYQYPHWMAIDDGDGSSRQFITDDEEVEVFVQMRRRIEEVNLCVTIALQTNGGGNQLLNIQPVPTQDKEIPCGEYGPSEDESSESDEDWHAFAISETPLTFPPSLLSANIANGGQFQTPPCTLPAPSSAAGIQIRENAEPVRLPSPACPRNDKGKGRVTQGEPETDSDSDKEENQLVPELEVTVAEVPQVVTRMRRQLFPPLPTEGATSSQPIPPQVNQQNEVDESPQLGSMFTWDRFQQSLHHMLNASPSDPAFFGRDAPPVFNNNRDDSVDSALSDVSYEGDNLFVGKVFKTKADCKIKIAIYAIHRKFHFRTTRSTPKFMVLNCVAATCKWRVYAVRLDASGNFQIRQASLIHTCTVDERRNYHKLATSQVIGEIMQSRFVGIKRGPNPSSIRKMLLDDYNVNVSYWKSWKAREIAMESALGSMAGSYALLPAYLAQVQNSNAGSICALEQTHDPVGGTRFKYCFVAYGASVHGYQFMRKVIVVDGTSLKGKYGGCLVSACAQDGNFQIFPLAFGIVDSENDDSWAWFFDKLNIFVPDSSDLVFISDRHASIYSGLRKVYPIAYHAACTVHLWRNVKSIYKKKRIACLMFDAASAFTVTEFNKFFLQIQQLSPGCAAYLVDIGFEHWTRAHFKGQRFNIMDTNIAESWNAVLKEAREYPLICMLEYIRTTLMGWFAIRRDKSTRQTGTLTPNVREIVEANYNLSTAMAVRPIGELEFQVQERDGECFTVKLGEFSCSCNEFQELGIPCPHALAAAACINVPSDVQVNVGYSVDKWARGYEFKIYPVPSVGSGSIGAGTATDLLPPRVRRPPGRPRTLRILSRGEFKRPRKASNRRCTNCRRKGHNKASCRNAF